ncbi:MAG TPA: rhomboid family intramembrane serine protease [Bacteroidia bacterium]|jgi:membrane associated rhomboid family serine protease|nr:rhomboid family intramembrane serine protease [Bacteroidia bacterium]
MSIIDDIKNTFRLKHNGLNRLILVNVAVFAIVNIVDALARLSGSFFLLEVPFLLPARFSLFMEHFWTLFTYMFFHTEFWHIFFNMMWLYSIGSIFAELMGSKRLVGTYILGGLSGGLLYLLVAAVFPTPFMGIGLLGASAGVMAVVVAAAWHAPNLTLQVFMLGPVRLKYIALVSFVLYSLIDLSSNTGGKVAHIGGAAFGLIFAMQYGKGNDLTRGLTGIFDMFGAMFKSRERQNVKIAYKRPVSDEVYNEKKLEEQKRVNAILDKISRSGYDSLSKEEKDFLFKASGKL